MTNPRPSSRITSLEKRTTSIEASIEEMAADTAEELKAIRQDIKGLDDGMRSSFTQIGDAFTLLDSNIEAIKGTMATKDNVNSRFDKVEGDIAELKGLITQLLQQKSGE